MFSSKQLRKKARTEAKKIVTGLLNTNDLNLVTDNLTNINNDRVVDRKQSVQNQILEAVLDIKKEVHTLRMREAESAKVIQRLTEEVVTLKMEVRKLGGSFGVGSSATGHLLPAFPLTEVDAVKALDAALHENPDHVLEFKQLLNRLGGIEGASFLRTAVKFIFTDELATKFSWKGTKEKPSAEMCFCLSIVKDFCHLKYRIEDKDMNATLQKHFLHAQDRINKRNPLKKRKENENTGSC